MKTMTFFAAVASLTIATLGCGKFPDADRVPAVSVQAISNSVAGRARLFAHYYPWWDMSSTCLTAPLKPARGWYNDQWGQVAKTVDLINAAKTKKLTGFAYQWKGQGSTEDEILSGMPNSAFLPALSQVNTSGIVFEWMLTFDLEHWAQMHGWWDCRSGTINTDSTAYSVKTGRTLRQQFADDMLYICKGSGGRGNYTSTAAYTKIASDRGAGNPALAPIFLYGYQKLVGNNVGPFVWDGYESCKITINGIKYDTIYLIGDFNLSAKEYANKSDGPPFWFKSKASVIDAVTSYNPFAGYGWANEASSQCQGFAYCEPYGRSDSTWRYCNATNWDQYTGPYKTRLDKYFENGQSLATSASANRVSGELSKKFYPTLVPQYFTGTRSDCTAAVVIRWNDNNYGYMPASRWTDDNTLLKSEQASLQQWDMVRSFFGASQPYFVFITSWNEPVEGTMIDPSKDANGEGYVMGSYFIDRAYDYASGL